MIGMAHKTLRIGVVGGTGYSGVELLRLLAQHPHCDLKVITSRHEAGTAVASMFPSLRGKVALDFSAVQHGIACRTLGPQPFGHRARTALGLDTRGNDSLKPGHTVVYQKPPKGAGMPYTAGYSTRQR